MSTMFPSKGKQEDLGMITFSVYKGVKVGRGDTCTRLEMVVGFLEKSGRMSVSKTVDDL